MSLGAHATLACCSRRLLRLHQGVLGSIPWKFQPDWLITRRDRPCSSCGAGSVFRLFPFFAPISWGCLPRILHFSLCERGPFRYSSGSIFQSFFPFSSFSSSFYPILSRFQPISTIFHGVSIEVTRFSPIISCPFILALPALACLWLLQSSLSCSIWTHCHRLISNFDIALCVSVCFSLHACVWALCRVSPSLCRSPVL